MGGRVSLQSVVCGRPRLPDELVQTVVSVRVGYGDGLAGDAVFFIGPITEIDEFTALTAKRTPGIILGPDDLFAAGRAFYLGAHRLQQLKEKRTSSSVTAARPGPGCMNLTVKRCLPPLTSA